MKTRMVVVLVVAICLVAGSLFAESKKSTNSYVVAGRDNLCHYYQWRWARCKDTPAPVAKPAPAPEKIVLEGVYFDTGSAKIKPESHAVLDANAQKLLKKKNMNVTIVGYTDNKGSPAKNMKLSEERAASVKAYMVSKGVDAGRIKTKGMGPESPIADNKTADGRAKNRRIEMEINK